MKMTMKIGLSALAFLMLLVSTISFLTTDASAGKEKKKDKGSQFTEASFEGTYAGYIAAARGGGAIGVIVTLIFDGDGSYSGTSTWNVEGQLLPTFNLEGSYTVSPDGFLRLLTEGGPLLGQESIAVITRSRKIKGRRVALEIAGLSDGLGPRGNVLTVVIRKQAEDSDD